MPPSRAFPLLRVAAIALAAGDAIAFAAGGAASPLAAMAAALAAAVLAARARREAARSASVAAAFLFGGLALGGAVAATERGRLLLWAEFEPKLVRVEGIVASPPVAFAPRVGPAGVTFDLAFDDAASAGEAARVRLDDPPEAALRRGDRVRVRGWLSPLDRPTNPGQEDRRPALYRAGRVADLRAGSGGNVVLVREGWHPLAPLDAARERARAAALRAAPGPGGALLVALFLGERRAVSREASDALRETGTIHLLAISGLHVLLLARALRALLDAAPLGEGARRAIVLAFLAAYAALVGFAPPVARAAVMAGAGEIAAAIGRRLTPIDALALSGVAVLAVDPGAVLDVGAQLSFAAVWALILLAPPLERALFFLPRRLARALALSIAATAATIPLLAWRFQLVSPGSVLLNLAAAPVVSAILVAGAPALLVSAIAENPASDLALRVLGVAFDVLVRGLSLAARVPGIALPVPPPSPLALGVAAAFLALAAAARRRPPRCVALLAAAAVSSVSGRVLPAQLPAIARITVLDVGQGAAAILETASGFRAALDCGSSSRLDAGARIVSPFLASRGAVGLDLVLLSHPDADHVNAVPWLRRRRMIGEVVGSESVAALELAPRAAAAGDVFECGGGVRIRVLHPPRGFAPEAKRSSARARNDASLVLAVETPSGRALVPGDVQDAGLAALLDAAPDDLLAADVVVLPHHGSFAEPLGELLRRARAKAAVASARRGFVPDSTRAALEAAGVPLYETAANGAVEIRFEGGAARAIVIGRGEP